ncbi:MAG: GDSL-type esterase/lipase family protein [Fimbriimonadaceae bacterium]
MIQKTIPIAVLAAVTCSANALDLGSLMPVGDSLTAGAAPNYYAWRSELNYIFQDEGYTYDFVGNRDSFGVSEWDGDHFSVGGVTTKQLLDGVDYWGCCGFVTGDTLANNLAAHNPDWVLLMVGHNDSLEDYTFESILYRTLNTVFDHDPNTKVVMASPGTSSQSGGFATYLKGVEETTIRLKDEYANKGHQITHVEWWSLMDPNVHYNIDEDRTHPNFAGNRVIAEQFHEGIKTLAAPVPEPATMTALGIGALALLRRRKHAN